MRDDDNAEKDVAEMKPTLKYIRYNPILCNILIGFNAPEILEEIIVSSSYNNNKN
jgi:hypothetical protein